MELGDGHEGQLRRSRLLWRPRARGGARRPGVRETHAGAGTPSQRPTYCDTATMGVVLGAAGLASTAFGTVLLYLDRSPPVMPVATVADHHVLFSLNGAF
jgi:hypothetical protein